MFVRTNLPCPMCSSSDAYAVDEKGWGHCFSCQGSHYEGSEDKPKGGPKVNDNAFGKADEIPMIPHEELTKGPIRRKIKQSIAEKYGYYLWDGPKGKQHVRYQCNDKGQRIGQKTRDAKKKFAWKGDKGTQMFGQWLFRDPSKDRVSKLIITEGEIDCLAVAQTMDAKWPVVSVNNGTGSAVQDIKNNLTWIEQFDKVILMFDNDEVGQDAIEKCYKLLTPGKAHRVVYPEGCKDAFDILNKHGVAFLKNVTWETKEIKSGGIVKVDDILGEVLKRPEMGLSWPWPELTRLTYGMHPKMIYTLGAGTGIGKTDWSSEVEKHLVVEHKQKIGVFKLEQTTAKTVKVIAGKIVGKAFHRPDCEYEDGELIEAAEMISDDVYIYDHSTCGSDWEDIKPVLLSMVVAEGVKWIFLDNVTVIAPNDPAEANIVILNIYAELIDMIQKHDFSVVLYSHLNKPKTGPDHENGGRVLESQLTGSRGAQRYSNYIFGLNRNKNHEDEEERNVSFLEILKDREWGNSGRVYMRYDKDTSVLGQIEDPTKEPAFDDSEGELL